MPAANSAAAPSPSAPSRSVSSRSVPWRFSAKLWFFVGFFALTILATYEKNARVFDPASPIAQHYAPATWFLPVHAVFGILALGLAAFQFSNRLRARYLRIHRVLGYVYVASVFVAGPFAILVAFKIPKPFSVIAELYAGPGLDGVHGDRALLHSSWQRRAASAMDDTELSVCDGVYRGENGSDVGAFDSAKPQCGRSGVLDFDCVRCVSAWCVFGLAGAAAGCSSQ